MVEREKTVLSQVFNKGSCDIHQLEAASRQKAMKCF